MTGSRLALLALLPVLALAPLVALVRYLWSILANPAKAWRIAIGFDQLVNVAAMVPMAAMAALIGCIANTLRLELVDFTGMPAAAAAFIGAATAGLLASFIKNYNGYPRISLTVPSIVIMVPGLYLYRAIYNFGIMSLTEAVSWFSSAIMIIVALPLGLIFARIITDRTFRYCT